MGVDCFALIMAGGGGTRLWPLSRRGRPKQTVPIFEARSLFRIAVDRLLPLFPPDRILVATVPELRRGLVEQAPDLPVASFLDEPAPRGTASIIGLAALLLHRRNPESVMACLTADHYIRDEEKFRDLLSAAYKLASSGELVTLGVSPANASTGYGYLQIGDQRETIDGFRVHQVKRFREKPGMETAVEYVSSGQYLWNSGMFIWRTGRILAEIERQMPDLYSVLADIGDLLENDPSGSDWQSLWHTLEPETIDYGVMENAEGVVTLVAEDLGWWDVGTWDRLFELLPGDEHQNVIRADLTIQIETRRSLVYQEAGGHLPRLIVTLGVEDLLIVDTGEALLITSRDSAQRIRDVVDRLGDEGLEKYL